MNRGFTLIELLVVISIIVLLLSLLAPALDKAIYEAELTTCGAQQKTIITSMQQYALANDRRYPQREWRFQAAAMRKDVGNDYNLLPEIQSVMSLQTMICPLSVQYNVEEMAASEPQAHLIASYDLYAGFNYDGHKGMKKVGDRWTWTDDKSESGKTIKISTNILVSDRDRQERWWNTWTSHPDKDGTLVEVPPTDNGPALYVVSRWQFPGEPVSDRNRGDIDMNTGYADGSVGRLYDVKANFFQDAPSHDERMVRVPEFGHVGDFPRAWVNIPKR